ncbi:MAG TPA: hypothetical protein VHZ97_15380 [Pseudonocardiaceae bacterium]|jgi:hypothetical protein|nr:hypothetical protein [Pseudonocardiaceae bacterium]
MSLRQRWGAQPILVRCGLLAYAIGFIVGTRAHVAYLISGGLHAYSAFGPVPVQVFFHLLLIADPIVVVLVLLARPVGIWLGLVVMVLDLAANVFANRSAIAHDWWWLVRPTGMLLLTFFGLFVFGTAIPLARRLPAGSPVG